MGHVNAKRRATDANSIQRDQPDEVNLNEKPQRFQIETGKSILEYKPLVKTLATIARPERGHKQSLVQICTERDRLNKTPVHNM